MGFGFSIKKLRENAGISVEKLTAKIGVNADRWRKWEQKDLYPRDEDQRKIEAFFSLTLAEIERLSSIKEFLIVPHGSRIASIMTYGEDEIKGTSLAMPEILTILAKAFDKQADAYLSQAKTIEIQAELIKQINTEMAREDTQAKIAANSLESLAGVLSLSIRQKQAIAEFRKAFEELKSQRSLQPPDSGRKVRETDGVRKKTGRSSSKNR